jgi:guanidinopropionase
MEAPNVNFSEAITTYQLWRGVPTFFGCPFEESPENVEIGLIGVPYSGGNTVQRMQYLAPRAVRSMSMGHRRSHRAFKINPFELCRIRDLGDVPFTIPTDPNRTIADIQAFYERVHRAGTVPMAIGGDHGITLPILRAIAGPQSRHHGPVGLIHLDAHTDAYPSQEQGFPPHGADWPVYGVAEGLIDPQRTVQVGIRGPMADLRQDDWAHQAGFRIIETEEFFDVGVQAVIAEVRRVVGDGPTYLSWDMDALDPTYAPAVTDPEADGITIRDALKLLVGLRGLNLVGGDVVEFNPPLDPPGLGITTYHATQIFYDMVNLVADGLAQRRQRGRE